MSKFEYTADDIEKLSDDLEFLSPRQKRLLGALLRLGLDTLENGDSKSDAVHVVDPFDGAKDVPTFRELMDLAFLPGRINEAGRTRGSKVGTGTVAVTRADGSR